eukprot:Sspe_Gene.13765::Locus_4732_Transcript_1_1_Confidence_1.000_Length_1518::g.13765::m.13765
MATCINRDLSFGVEGVSAAVLDWLRRRTCYQNPSAVTHVALRVPDVATPLGPLANRVDMHWLPGFARLDLASAVAQAHRRAQVKVAGWSRGGDKGWWTSIMLAQSSFAATTRLTNRSRTCDCFWKRDPSPSLPVRIKAGLGVSHQESSAPNLFWGMSLGFPHSLSASLCADVYRRWTSSFSYSVGCIIASARFAGNVATKADSVLEFGTRCSLDKLWSIFNEGSYGHFSWTRDGVAIGASIRVDRPNSSSSRGLPVIFSAGILWPIGQPLGEVEQASRGLERAPEVRPTDRAPKVFVGLELRPWLGGDNQPDQVLGNDPLGLFGNDDGFSGAAPSDEPAADDKGQVECGEIPVPPANETTVPMTTARSPMVATATDPQHTESIPSLLNKLREAEQRAERAEQLLTLSGVTPRQTAFELLLPSHDFPWTRHTPHVLPANII